MIERRRDKTTIHQLTDKKTKNITRCIRTRGQSEGIGTASINLEVTIDSAKTGRVITGPNMATGIGIITEIRGIIQVVRGGLVTIIRTTAVKGSTTAMARVIIIGKNDFS